MMNPYDIILCLAVLILALLFVIALLWHRLHRANTRPPPWRRQTTHHVKPPVMDEIEPALGHIDYAGARLAQYMWKGVEVMEAIDYARRQLDLAEREIRRVDPESRPAKDQPEFGV